MNTRVRQLMCRDSSSEEHSSGPCDCNGSRYRALTVGGNDSRNKIDKNIKLLPTYGLKKGCWALLHQEHSRLQVLSSKYFHKK